MNKFKKVLRSKLMIFIVQIAILSVFIYLVDYAFKIDFDSNITEERREIIQFLANYILFDTKNSYGIILICVSWIIVATLPILAFNDYKKATSLNFTTFFFPNFFFYVFLYRYSRNYYDSHFPHLFTLTIFLGAIILCYSIVVSLVLKKIKKPKKKAAFENLKLITQKNKSKCPYCGTNFDSIPKYCYKCLKEIALETSSEEIST